MHVEAKTVPEVGGAVGRRGVGHLDHVLLADGHVEFVGVLGGPLEGRVLLQELLLAVRQVPGHGGRHRGVRRDVKGNG